MLDMAGVAIAAQQPMLKTFKTMMRDSIISVSTADLKLTHASFESIVKDVELRLDQGNLYICLVTAWDLMLGTEVSKKQKEADIESVKKAIKEHAPTFPKWANH